MLVQVDAKKRAPEDAVEAECAAMMKSMEKEQVAAAAKIQANFRGNQVMESARACRCYFSEQVQETC